MALSRTLRSKLRRTINRNMERLRKELRDQSPAVSDAAFIAVMDASESLYDDIAAVISEVGDTRAARAVALAPSTSETPAEQRTDVNKAS